MVDRSNSWGARMFSRVVRVRLHVDEDSLEHWRRLHRRGHSILAQFGGSVDFRRRQQLPSAPLCQSRRRLTKRCLANQINGMVEAFPTVGRFCSPSTLPGMEVGATAGILLWGGKVPIH